MDAIEARGLSGIMNLSPHNRMLTSVWSLVFFPLYLATTTNSMECTSEEVSFDLESNTCILSGKPTIIVYEKFKFYADKITIIYEDKKCKRPKIIKAEGNIRFESDECTVAADGCECNMEHVRFIGNVLIVNQKLGKIKADSARYDLKTKKIDIQARKKVTFTVSDDLTQKLKQKSK
jgi:lipopolysaccharide export system protein LptA